MPKLDINGYNATFRTFIEFAQKTQKDGYDSACAKATFSNRRITVSALSLNETSALLRKTAEKTSNDSTRAIFKTAIIDMFGGEEKIPASVKKAMIMDDYGDGKPLTARASWRSRTPLTPKNPCARRVFRSSAIPRRVKPHWPRATARRNSPSSPRPSTTS